MSSKKRGGFALADYFVNKKARGGSSDNDEPLGSDDELPNESIKDCLSWRRDDPFSDWKIVVVVKKLRDDDKDNSDDRGTVVVNELRNADKDSPGDDRGTSEETEEETTYNVRKSILADGPRRSEYFVHLFGSDGNFSEAQDSTSRIELTELAAMAFPELLDYVYTVGHEMSFTTESATALYSLAKYFGVRRLENEAKKFCLQDMNTKTCGTYYYHASILQVDNILQAATKVCHDNFAHLSPDVRVQIAEVPNPQFWLDLMSEHAEKGTISDLSDDLSNYIGHFCINHSAVLSLDIFKQLTDEKYLPQINPIAAIRLMDVERCITQRDEGQRRGASGGRDELSSLQTRCLNTIAQPRNKLRLGVSLTHITSIREALEKQPPSFLVEIIARGFCPPS